MKLKVIKPFDWAHQNVRVESFVKGQTFETDDEDLIRVATEEGWVQRTRASKETAADTAGEQDAEFPPADPDAKGGENNPLTAADAAADLAGDPRPA
jgi:hypothetical protein